MLRKGRADPQTFGDQLLNQKCGPEGTHGYGCWFMGPVRGSGIFVHVGRTVAFADRAAAAEAGFSPYAASDGVPLLLPGTSATDAKFTEEWNDCSYGCTALLRGLDSVQIGSLPAWEFLNEIVLVSPSCTARTSPLSTTCVPGLTLRTGWAASKPCTCLEGPELNCDGGTVEPADAPPGVSSMTLTRQRCRRQISRARRTGFVSVLVLGAEPTWWAPNYRALNDAELAFGCPQYDDAKLKLLSSGVLRQRGGIVVPMFEMQRALFAPGETPDEDPPPGVAAPPMNVFATFEGKMAGKAKTAAWLRAHGLGEHAIREYPVEKTLALPNPPLPLVVKPTHGWGGVGIQIVRDREALHAAVHAIRVATREAAKTDAAKAVNRPIIQEAVLSAEEWGVYFSAFRGELLNATCLRFVFASELFVRRGSQGDGLSQRVQSPCSECPFGLAALRRLVAETRYHGWGCLAIKPRPNNGPGAFIEMNTRVGASLLSQELKDTFVGMIHTFAGKLVAAKSRRRHS